MDYELIIQAISTVGFPIIMCLLMLYFLHKESEDHKEEMNQLKDVISRNNEVLEID